MTRKDGLRTGCFAHGALRVRISTMTAYLILLVVFVVLTLGAYLCLRGRWVLAWLRGTLGLGLIVVALLMILYGMDLRYYQVLSEEQPVARVLVNQIDDQLW